MKTAFRSRLNLEQLGERIVPSTTDTIPGAATIPAAQVVSSPDMITLENRPGTWTGPGTVTLLETNPYGYVPPVNVATPVAPNDRQTGSDDEPEPMTAEDAAAMQAWLEKQWAWAKDLANGEVRTTNDREPPVVTTLTPAPATRPVVPAVNPFGPTGEPQPGTISQGKLGDCWFLATLEGLARTNPQAVKEMIEMNADGTYTVKFPGREPVIVTYNPAVGIDKDGVTHRGAKSNGIWARIIEQGAGEIVGNRLHNGDVPLFALDFFLGEGHSDYNTKKHSSEGTWRKKLIERVGTNKVIVASSSNDYGTDANGKTIDEKDGILARHSYTVVAYDAATDQVRLRNPHGANSLVFGADTPTGDGTGEFWMSMHDFYLYFKRITYEKL